MALSRRYANWPPGETTFVGFDFSAMLPPGVALTSGELSIVINRNPPQAQSDFTQEPVQVTGRQAWCFISGGAAGTDYQCRWTVSDNLNNTWHRTSLLLCAESA